MLEELYLTRLRFMFRALEPIALPRFSGNTLRGAFGRAFRKVSCPIACKNPATCMLRHRCAYSVCFETPVPEGADAMRKYPYAPHPFVLEPPPGGKTPWERGETFEVDVTLAGRGADFLAHFVYAFEEVGAQGIGRDRGKAELIELRDLSAASPFAENGEGILWRRGNDTLVGMPGYIGHADVQQWATKWGNKPFRVTFLTPMRIKRQGQFTQAPDMSVLMPPLLRRLNMVNYFHCKGPPKTDVGLLLEAANKVETRRAKVRWVELERYSHRQKARMKFGGFVGEASYGRLPPELAPLLLWGQFFHVGKASAFGLGKYQLISFETESPAD